MINHISSDAAAQAIAAVQQQVTPDPNRVVGVGQLEGAVPIAGVGPCLRVVVGRHLHDTTAHQAGELRRVLELLGVEPQAAQCQVRITQFFVDDFRQALDAHQVRKVGVVAVRSQSTHTHQRTSEALWQINSVGSLVLGRSLIIQRCRQNGLVAAPIDRQVNGVVDAVTDLVAVGFDLPDLRPGQADSHSRQLLVGNCVRPGVVRLQLNRQAL
nr:hypothetical protein [Pseudomonas tolaasii]